MCAFEMTQIKQLFYETNFKKILDFLLSLDLKINAL